MNRVLKSKNGITLVALVITVVVLLILVSITVNLGMEAINQAKLENIKTNMLLLQAKLKTYAEEAQFEGVDSIEKLEDFSNICTSVSSNSSISAKAKSAGVSDTSGWYYFTNEQMETLGLKDIQDDAGEFIVKFDIENATVKDTEIIYTTGWKGNYTLKAINEL